MSVQQQSVPAGSSPKRLRWLLWSVALAVGLAAGALIVWLRGPSTSVPASVAPAAPDATWAAGKRPAPDFSLSDQAGRPISLARFRGRPVLLTFIDPLCRNLCPLEAKILDRIAASFPAAQRPAIVAVSVNRWGNARHILLQDVQRWKLPAQWHWAVGPAASLRRVWASYEIGVSDSPKTVAGITVHNISHTEGSYLIDARGDERALWLYPFQATDVERTIRSLAGAAG